MAGNYKDDKSKVPTEAELEAMLDMESDEDFGQTELEVASVDQRAVLKEWTAQDFANIYTRFRPHLERHARRFLRNPSQVDEVVQDAFLYLMVTLPELDSELGVLRFLKWKVRLLCLDVIRANSKAFVADIDEHGEFEADMPEMGSDLERAEDAAIVRLALAKLQPRHREVLIASIYEEKSTIEIAGQVGLGENATRQLLLRARKSLKKALVGELDTRGMSINQILSVAARKAALDMQQNGTRALATIALLAASALGLINSITYSQVSLEVAEPEVLEESARPLTPDYEGSVGGKDEFLPAENQTESVAGDVTIVEPEIAVVIGGLSEQVDTSPFNPWVLDNILERNSQLPISVVTSAKSVFANGTYTLLSDSGVWADFYFDADADVPISKVRLGFLVEDAQYTADLDGLDFSVTRLSTGYEIYEFYGQAFAIYDGQGNFYSQTRLAGALVSLSLTVDPVMGQVVGGDLYLTEPS
ncbi:MAG: hypothetical protein RIS51_482 [Actinomycetota bacterium]|jgi:RNA polymerase sigma-70 factor (ECF subfamily)